MAVFGAQLVVTMIAASILHKILPFYSLGRWLITAGLSHFLPPSDKLLRPLIATHTSQASKNTKKKTQKTEKALNSQDSTPDELYTTVHRVPIILLDPNLAVPKSANIKLMSCPLKWIEDVDRLHFSGELEFMINLTFVTVLVFILTFIYYSLCPQAYVEEYNLCVIWLVVTLLYSFKVLFSLTRIYLSEELSHQRSLIIVFTTLLFVCALGVLLIDESVLDFGLEVSHRDISKSLSILLEALLKNKRSVEIIPIWSFKILMAFFCSGLSMVLVFPGFRFADTHFSTVYHSKAPLFKTLLHANYIAPMFCLSLWIRPTQDMIAERSNVNFFGLVDISYQLFRVVVIVFVCVLRMALFRTYLQSYLDTARWRVENLRQEQGRITIANLRLKVSNIYLFYAALGVQYIAPYIFLLCVTLMLYIAIPVETAVESVRANFGNENINIFRSSGFGASLFQGCMAFVCWWVCFTNAVTSGFGAVLKEFI